MNNCYLNDKFTGGQQCAGAGVFCYHQKVFLFIIKQFPTVTSYICQTALHCTALYCTVLYCTVLNCTILYCVACQGEL